MKKVIVLAGIVFLLSLAGCNDNDDTSESSSTETEIGECRPMFS